MALSAGAAGAVIGLTAATPAGASINANTTYEFDCTTSLSAGTVAPFAVTANLNASPDPSAPTGASFGASGAVSVSLVGPFIGGLAANGVVSSTVGLDLGGVTIGSTDGTATGSYAYSHNFAAVAAPSSSLGVAAWAAGATTLTVTSGTPVVGDGLESGTALPNGEAIAAVSGSTVTLSIPATAAGAAQTLTQWGGVTFTDSAVSTGSVFTTNGSNGGAANIGITAATTFGIVGNLTVPFGGAAGVGTANCLETGYDAAGNPGPAQSGATGPSFPFSQFGTATGQVSFLVAASGGFVAQPGTTQNITPAASSYVNLADTAPTPNNQTISVGEGQSGTVTLTATAGSYPVGTFSLVGGSPQTVGSLTITQASAGSATVNLTNTASASETDTFQFNACDTLSASNGGPVCSTTPGTITVVIGTPPVIQPFSQQVNAGQLVLSCDSPANYVTGNSTPTPTANPLLQCPEFQFPSVTLDGLEQQVTGTTGNSGGNPGATNAGTIYISDNRGGPTDQWTLTGTFIPTAVGSGNGQNPNASCSGVDAFCNSTVGAAALNVATNGAKDGQIPPNYLQVSAITCTADASGGLSGPDGTAYNPPNLNPDASPTTGGNFGSAVTLCSAAAGQSGGTFLYNATYTLTIPESVYAGNYFGSVQYTVA